MAHTEYPPAAFDPTYLNQNEQDLLTTALNSNQPRGRAAGMQGTPVGKSNQNTTVGSDFYTSPIDQVPGSGEFDQTPFLDYEGLEEVPFDWDVEGEMIGDLPGTANEMVDDEEPRDKRKNPADEDDTGKQRSPEDKTNKKPGRKPLTSEPTTKRKAQNRAAQRAFRERKERHLKELEAKVDDLEKASEATNHENGLLRAQVERLQTELREYRKRLSITSPVNRYSPQSSPYALSSKSQWDINNNFQFAFPRFLPFGADPSLGSTRNTSISSPTSATQPNHRNSLMAQPTFPSEQPQNTFSSPGMDELNGLFSPTILASVSSNSEKDYINFNNQQGKSPAGASVHSKVSEPANSDANSNSPDSSANNGFTSSCVTTPEYSAESPDQRKAGDGAFNSISADGQRRKSSISHEAFCKEFSKACGNKENPMPPSMSESNQTPASTTSTEQPHTPLQDNQNLDWFANQNGGIFDPILFGDYRDPQENIMNGDFGGFFQDAYPVNDLGESQPLETNLPKKRDLMKEIEEQQAGKESEVVPGEHPKQFLTCNMLWDRVQRSEKVQNGEADMDDLCAQLKAKAKCSGHGAVIDQKDVDAILGPMPEDKKDFLKMFK